MYRWRIAVMLACVAVCLCQDATEPTASPSPSAAIVTVTSPRNVTGSAATGAVAGIEGSTSVGDTAISGAPVTSPPSDVTTAGSTTVVAESSATTTVGAEEGSAAEEVTTSGAPEATVAPSSATVTVGSTSSAPETTPEPAAATSAKASTDAVTTVASSIAETVTTAALSVATTAETVAEPTAVSSPETTPAPSTEAAETPGTTVAAEAVETTVAVETTQATDAPDATSSQSAPTPATPAATSAEVTSPEVTSPGTHPPSSSPSADPAGETSNADTESPPHTPPAASSATDISTTEAADEQTVTAPMEYYGYPRSMTMQEMGIPEVEGAVTMLISPRRISFLAWLGVKESVLRTAILNITRDNGFNSSDLEWVYISPSPTYRSPHILLSFLIVWRGGGPAEGTVTSTAASRSSGDDPPETEAHSTAAAAAATATATAADYSPSVTPSVTAVTSDPAATPGSRRRRAVGGEEGGVVPAELLRRMITDNADQLGTMVSADLESTSAGLEAPPNACSRQDESFMATNGQMMLALSVAAGICICLTCGALLYVRVIRDSGHWEPQPAYHEGERVGGLDLHSDGDCKKGEEPRDDNGKEAIPLTCVSNTPRGSLRGAARV